MKKFLILSLIVLLTGCSAPGTALLGPAFTGATTKSVAQASLSFGTNQIIRNIHNASQKSKNEIKKIVKKVEDFEIISKLNISRNFHR